MDFLTLAKKRYSVRAYTKQKVEKEKLDAILEAAHVAPTGGNCQPQHLIVVQSDEGLRKIGKATNIYGAPLAIIVCSDTNKVWTRPFDGKKLTDIDASIITDHMMMEATYLGLGSVWVSASPRPPWLPCPSRGAGSSWSPQRSADPAGLCRRISDSP